MLYMVKIAEGGGHPKVYYAHPCWPFMMSLDGMPVLQFEAIFELDDDGSETPMIYVTEPLDHVEGLPRGLKLRRRMEFGRPARTRSGSTEYVLKGLTFIPDFEAKLD